MTEVHRVYLVPGMFGFATLAGYDYFHHVREALRYRFSDAGVQVITEVVPTPPTSSLRHRARILAQAIEHSAGQEDPIHLIGHSTGGLDIRLLMSPTTNLGNEHIRLRFRERVSSAITLNSPHYGTPLAGYFTTVSGARMLYVLSLLTVVSLSIGEPSLAVFSRLLAGVGSIDQLLGGDIKLLSRVTDNLLRILEPDGGRGELKEFLSQIRNDQGALVQIMPEAMDLFNAAAEDDPRIRYGCVATAAPPPKSLRLANRIRSPYAAATAAMYSTLYQFTGQRPDMYPYAQLNEATRAKLRSGIHRDVGDTANDGVVPTLSMLWGTLLWSGEADHLDVLGHFHDDRKPAEHVDWMTSGAHFNRTRFSALMDAIVSFALAG